MRPFDIEAAKRGEPLITRDGRPAKFVAHVPECSEYWRVIYLAEGCSSTTCVSETGHATANIKPNLFMAPRKVVKWTVVYRSGRGVCSSLCATKEIAIEMRNGFPRSDDPIIARVEWEE